MSVTDHEFKAMAKAVATYLPPSPGKIAQPAILIERILREAIVESSPDPVDENDVWGKEADKFLEGGV